MFIISLIILIFSAILHEIAHGYVADRLGDPTARLMGRLTLDPRKHIDPFMTILLPLFLLVSGSTVLFGGAKPVPIDPFNLKEGRKDLALVSLAGPLTNLLLAFTSALLFRILFSSYSFYFVTSNMFSINNITDLFAYIVAQMIQINLLLAIFNLLPIPPLDGSKVFAMLLPEKEARAYLGIGTFGIAILFFLLFFPIGGFSLTHLIGSLTNTLENILLP